MLGNSNDDCNSTPSPSLRRRTVPQAGTYGCRCCGSVHELTVADHLGCRLCNCALDLTLVGPLPLRPIRTDYVLRRQQVFPFSE
jgi:hypothetical protein